MHGYVICEDLQKGSSTVNVKVPPDYCSHYRNRKLGHDKIRDLITKDAEPGSNFAVQLGKRAEKVNISNEKDCIKVYCKGWVEKQTWREINDILRINGFAWLSNGKDSCWIKPTS